MLPVIFLLGIFFKISSSSPLQANDTAKQEKTGEKKTAIEVETKEVDGKTVMVVPTEKTDKEISRLNKENYGPDESLITPVVALSDSSVEKSKETRRVPKDGDVQIPKANVKVMDGAATFDNDNNPGHDKDNSNNIVRSFDQISYLLDFSVQNMNVDVTYTNIKYQVTATLPDAITLMADDKTPQINAEVANGKYYHPNGTLMTDDDTGPGYSEGIVESSISDTGQVFIPIVINVFGAPHGQKLQPTFKITIISADRVNSDGTTETVEIDDTYDHTYDEDESFKSLAPAETTVSSKPNIMVQLKQGKIQNSSEVFDQNPSTIKSDTYNIGAVTTLKPLDEHSEFANPYVGVCYPKGTISYTFNHTGSYSGNKNGTLSGSSQITPPGIGAYAPAVLNRTMPFTDNLNEGLDLSGLSVLKVPNANTGKTAMTVPETDFNERGVYNSGTFTASKSGSVTNSGYIPLQSNYIYDMEGNAVKKDWTNAFSSLELLMYWDRTATENFLGTTFAGQYSVGISVNTVTFDGITVDNTKDNTASKLIFTTAKNDTPGSGFGGVNFFRRNPPDDSQAFKIGNQTVVGWGAVFPASSETASVADPIGNERLNAGDDKAYLGSTFALNNKELDKYTVLDQIFMFDPSTFQFDESRYVLLANTQPKQVHYMGRDIAFEYGVAKTADTPWKSGTTKVSLPIPGTSPTQYTQGVKTQISNYSKTYNDQFVWFDNPKQARTYALANSTHAGIGGKYGESDGISAVRIRFEFMHEPDAPPGALYNAIPLKVLQKTEGVVSPAGNTIGGLVVEKVTDPKTGETLEPGIHFPASSQEYNNGQYQYTNYNTNGSDQRMMKYWNWLGTSAYIRPFNITTTTEVKEAQYLTDQEIDISVRGYLDGSDSPSYDTALNTTLPKGISYKEGSSTDIRGAPLPDPATKENPDGSTTLRWVFPNSDFDQGVEVKFKATSDISNLDFDDTGLTSSLNVKTVGEMWITGNPSNKDESSEVGRSSSDTFREKLDQQLVLTKKIDKEAIEVGIIDPADSKATSSTDFTYTVTGENNSIQDLPTLKLLDVLPYNGDDRKTSFNGSYNVQSVKVTLVDSKGKTLPAPASSKLYYTTTAPGGTYNEKSDPNKITGWTEATSSIPVPDNARGLLVEANNIPTGGKILLKITLRPDGEQLAGDVYRNNARMNSVIDNPVTSQVVETKVYGRDLTGYVWYDDNYNGLIDSTEAPVGNIPVKLYRTSYKNSSYTDKLVEESLTGEKFVDSTGESKVKTDSNGEYSFSNLPEGEYIAKFIVEDIVVTKKIAIVTKKKVGSDDTLNSKADPTTFKTDEYDLPEIEELPTKVVSGESIHHTKDVNAGLTRLSKIRLFKYEEGTVIDADNDGHLSDAEIEASTTNALEGAEFQLYKGKKDDPDTIKDENKIGSPVATGSDGWLEFASLPPGFYTIVETKAPAGFELLKNPIEVEVPTYNYIAIVHVPDKGQTKLPFTGSTKAARIILIVSACLLVIGMTGVFLHFRPIKVRGGN
ncbi:SpaA isopeptide-forming pilin-related protein [Enterococcus sp.]|uniref:SpaA isopeptide-forming pilin-related protein n=1 Tax=Enterococcus sp. TaxID=35783 RepID=UPI002915BE02|nr:SpaA isopeptide-forming pilin-related protein [Enterococcus sp.]MDU5334685.1 SpaA isopeptide-forming pilin-related protein [Enterococcus sp.]